MDKNIGKVVTSESVSSLKRFESEMADPLHSEVALEDPSFSLVDQLLSEMGKLEEQQLRLGYLVNELHTVIKRRRV